MQISHHKIIYLSIDKYLTPIHRFPLLNPLKSPIHFISRRERERELQNLIFIFTPTHYTQLLAMAASLNFLSLAPQTLSLHHSSSSAAASASTLFAPSSLKPLPKLVLALSPANNFAHPTSRFVRNVAISSELDEEVEGEDGFDGPEEQSFSPDLKLFVGNLPFNVDSAALAELFQQAGNVEMVEVNLFLFCFDSYLIVLQIVFINILAIQSCCFCLFDYLDGERSAFSYLCGLGWLQRY